MVDLSGVHVREDARQKLAAQVAAFEAENGPVKTLPIRIGNSPIETFSINSPGKQKSMPSSSQSLRAKDHDRITIRKQKRNDNVEKVRELALTGITIEAIADQAGLSRKYVLRLIREHNIPRRPTA